MEIGPLVPEKKLFEGFLPYMCMAATLTRCREQTFVPPNHGGSTQNLAVTGPAIFVKNLFEFVDDDGEFVLHISCSPVLSVNPVISKGPVTQKEDYVLRKSKDVAKTWSKLNNFRFIQVHIRPYHVLTTSTLRPC